LFRFFYIHISGSTSVPGACETTTGHQSIRYHITTDACKSLMGVIFRKNEQVRSGDVR